MKLSKNILDFKDLFSKDLKILNIDCDPYIEDIKGEISETLSEHDKHCYISDITKFDLGYFEDKQPVKLFSVFDFYWNDKGTQIPMLMIGHNDELTIVDDWMWTFRPDDYLINYNIISDIKDRIINKSHN